jgi:hypothetical protein
LKFAPGVGTSWASFAVEAWTYRTTPGVYKVTHHHASVDGHAISADPIWTAMNEDRLLDLVRMKKTASVGTVRYSPLCVKS